MMIAYRGSKQPAPLMLRLPFRMIFIELAALMEQANGVRSVIIA